MPATNPAEPADPRRTTRHDRHGRREPRTTSKRAGLCYTVAPPKTVPMSGDDYDHAVRAWAVLIAAWLSKPDNERTEQTGPT